MSVYDKSLEQIQNSYQFTDLEMAKMDYTLKVFAYELSKLVFFFVFFAFCFTGHLTFFATHYESCV